MAAEKQHIPMFKKRCKEMVAGWYGHGCRASGFRTKPSSRWKDHREQCMGAVLSMIADMGVRSREEKMILLLGGEYNGRRVAHWLRRSINSETITCGPF